jgi:hypothetical protein
MPTPDNFITLSEFHAWLEHPITRIVAADLEKRIEKLTASLAHGSTVDADSVNGTAMNTAFRVGYIQGLEQAFDPPSTVLVQQEDIAADEEEDED